MLFNKLINMIFRTLLQLALVSAASGACRFISSDSSLHSNREAGQDVEIQFSNPGNGDFDIFWVDQFNREVDMGLLESGAELGFITNAGMAWRIKLHGTGLVVLEYVIEDPIREPIILSAERRPLLALTVGQGCANNDKDGVFVGDIYDPLKLFESDRNGFSVGDSLKKTVTLEVTASSEMKQTEHVGHQDGDEEEKEVNQCAGTDQWVNKYLAAEGYHVICLSSPPHLPTLEEPHVPGISFQLQGWKSGHLRLPSGEVQSASTFAEFRAHLEVVFGINRTDAWRVKSAEAIRRSGLKADGSSKWAYLPQRWRLFDVHRHPVESLSDVRSGQLLLMFEGGQFIYPGVDLNFERSVSFLDRQYVIKTLSLRPLLLQVDDLLVDIECAYMIDYSRPRMVPSDVSLMDKDKGKPATDFRTSQYVFMTTKSHAPLQRLDKRIANITGLDIRNQEDAQILKYEVGNYYLSHNDYWSPAFYQAPDMVAMTHGGHKNRLATVFWYMNSDVTGGCTSFTRAPVHHHHASQTLPPPPSPPPVVSDDANISSSIPEVQDMIDCDYGLKVSPKKGRAIIFYSLLPSGRGDDLAEHAACAVTSGTKWAANKWIWNQQRW